ncbi:three-Cys-motif partner protein TcmP [Micromonospora chersina]|uniref:three-Cys-motif partner protein TcmP n=1 Tax=Micromonospora chersina TaxID=47854 RepID=UPI003C9CF41D
MDDGRRGYHVRSKDYRQEGHDGTVVNIPSSSERPLADKFFKRRQAAAAFKHAILSRYPVVFASKLGSTAKGSKVVFLDGYAGRGRYQEDQKPGSPLLLAAGADRFDDRNIFGFFVERDKGNAAVLRQVLHETDTKMQYEVIQGDLDDHLDAILRQIGSAPLFAFLDPFGTALDYSRLRTQLLNRRSGPTEVLLHFTASGVARMGGILRSARGRDLTDVEQKQVVRVDRFLGGAWWREYFSDVNSEENEERATNVALRVSDEFARLIRRETGFLAVTMPIRPKPDLLPKYVLALFTRKAEGLWCFADTLGYAGMDWHAAWLEEDDRRRLGRDGDQGVFDIFASPGWQFDKADYEAREAPSWIAEIEQNILRLLERGTVRLDERVVEVYGNTLGVAWGKHIKAAVKNLHRDRVIVNTGVGTYYYREPLVRRA